MFKRIKTFKKTINHHLALLALKMNIGFKKDWVFLLPYGAGDSFFLCLLISEFKKKNKGRVVVVMKESHHFICDLFSEVDEFIALNKRFKKLQLQKISPNQSLPIRGKIFIPHPLLNSGLSGLEKKLSSDYTLLDMYKTALGLELKCSLGKFDFSTISQDIVQNFVTSTSWNLQKTIILFPSASSLEAMNENLMRLIVAKIIGLGFNVIVNGKLKLDNFTSSRVKSVDFALKDMIALAIHCNSVISARSGVCDLLAFSGKKMVVTYPNKAAYDTYSLNPITKRNNHLLLELVLSEMPKQDLVIEKISEFLGS